MMGIVLFLIVFLLYIFTDEVYDSQMKKIYGIMQYERKNT